MNAFAYREPYRLSAGALTLITHALFFAALYFGVNWRVQQPEGMQVDLWGSLPEAAVQPAVPAPPPVEAPVPPPQQAAPTRQKEVEAPAPPAKADIELKQKKKPAPNQQVKPKPAPTRTPSKAERKQAEAEMQAQLKQEELAEQQARTARDAAAAQAAKARAAIAGEVDKYKGLIQSKVRRNIVMPPDVADDATAEFLITLLPSGDVLDVQRVKSSGNAAYDSAVERAIWKAKTLPLPPDEEARTLFVNPSRLRLRFNPRDGD